MAGSLKTVAHAILSPYALYLYLNIVQVWVYILGDPQSVQQRNATTMLPFKRKKISVKTVITKYRWKHLDGTIIVLPYSVLKVSFQYWY